MKKILLFDLKLKRFIFQNINNLIMPTTIKISDASKNKLEKLRARLLLQGRKFKQEELIDFVISLAETSPLILSKGKYKGLSKEERKEFLAFSFEGGGSDKSIDEEVYS